LIRAAGTIDAAAGLIGMDRPSHEMSRVLRQARLYGYLYRREGGVFYPGANKPAGRLEPQGERYVIMPEDASVEAQH
jgi:hypothetical protein